MPSVECWLLVILSAAKELGLAQVPSFGFRVSCRIGVECLLLVILSSAKDLGLAEVSNAECRMPDDVAQGTEPFETRHSQFDTRVAICAGNCR